jgi:ribosomal protein S27E
MWPSGDTDEEVTCIACGAELQRSAAREYDKHGDRWERRDKEFEYLCKPCDRELCHQPRGGLEATLASVETESLSQSEFLEAYREAAEDEPEPERGSEP